MTTAQAELAHAHILVDAFEQAMEHALAQARQRTR
jgi:hypothetical protein